MPINEKIKKVLSEVKRVLSSVTEDDIQQFIQKICASRRVFVAGSGRSGILTKAFAMRLMQMGFTVHVVGETTTPAIMAGDLLLLISGSGETLYSQEILRTAKKSGAYTYLITANENSCMGKLVEGKIIIPGSTKSSSGKIKSEQIAGSLFEQGAFIFLECVIHTILTKLKMNHREIMSRHANLE